MAETPKLVAAAKTGDLARCAPPSDRSAPPATDCHDDFRSK